MDMKDLKNFLELSTIHGLYYLSSARRWARLFWILVVISGFSGAIFLINESFYNWEQSPIKTTIETLPISKITFPNITVCPPKNTFLDLNFDIKQSENLTLSVEQRKELTNYTFDIIQEEFHKDLMTNLSKVVDPGRYHCWYYGYTEIKYPYNIEGQECSKIFTSASSGDISTQHFDDQFDSDLVDGNLCVEIHIYVPDGRNITLSFDIEKKTINEVSGKDEMRIQAKPFEPEETEWKDNETLPFPYNSYIIDLHRKVSKDNIKNIKKMDLMPGFRIKWKRNGNNHNELYPKYQQEENEYMKEFVR